jgi:OOP family OmpA-OmpF porin
MKKISIAVLLSTAVISSAAFADASGFFAAVDAQNWSASGGGGNITNPSTGYRIGGGYNFTQNWGVEVDYAKSGDATQPGGGTLNASSTQLVGVGTYPINNMFSVYGKLGVASNKVGGSNASGCTICSTTSTAYGAGGVYNINKQFGVRLEYLHLGNMTGSGAGGPATAVSANTTSLGLVYNF